jgi:hypothetical protein
MPRKRVPLLVLAALAAAWCLTPPRSGALAAQEKSSDAKKVPALLSAKPLSTTDQKDKLRRLVRERYNLALEEVRARYRRYQDEPNSSLELIFDALHRLRVAGVEAADTGRGRIEFLQRYVELTRYIEQGVEQGVKAGGLGGAERVRARYLRVDAELQLLRAQRDLSGPKGPKGR